MEISNTNLKIVKTTGQVIIIPLVSTHIFGEKKDTFSDRPQRVKLERSQSQY
jgi:hypothetical protein